MFLLKFSLLSKTVLRYLYSVTLSTFTPSVKRSGMTVGAESSEHFIICVVSVPVQRFV